MCEGGAVCGAAPAEWACFSLARCQFFCRLTSVLQAIDFRGALDRLGDAAANIFRADMPFELRMLHQSRRLFPCAAEQQRTPGFMQRVREVANGAKAGGVNGGPVSPTHKHDRQ